MEFDTFEGIQESDGKDLAKTGKIFIPSMSDLSSCMARLIFDSAGPGFSSKWLVLSDGKPLTQEVCGQELKKLIIYFAQSSKVLSVFEMEGSFSFLCVIDLCSEIQKQLKFFLRDGRPEILDTYGQLGHSLPKLILLSDKDGNPTCFDHVGQDGTIKTICSLFLPSFTSNVKKCRYFSIVGGCVQIVLWFTGQM